MVWLPSKTIPLRWGVRWSALWISGIYEAEFRILERFVWARRRRTRYVLECEEILALEKNALSILYVIYSL